ncbi:hypothetical protein [Colwellia psychrerythraea]|uniref:Lipoprotein n=1 Tax=Colwellia psychrerythraea TaxID=28229 RepID=A0A099K818_COLPS|nr:hypothetical protein [Colwellia psychrerythraea]KGJ86440.1 hypothetical protein ND2E_1006 [Colwellia psychrerythraea]
MKNIFILCFMCVLSGCGSLASTLPYHKPAATYDEFKKQWEITSTRWGNNGENTGDNRTFIRVYVLEDGTLLTQLYSEIKTQNKFYPSYAITSNGTKLNVNEVNWDVRCSAINSSCTYYQDTVITIDYQDLASELEQSPNLKIALYGRQPKQVIQILSCQFWEVYNEIKTIKKITDAPRVLSEQFC